MTYTPRTSFLHLVVYVDRENMKFSTAASFAFEDNEEILVQQAILVGIEDLLAEAKKEEIIS